MCPPPHLAAPASPELAQSDRDAQPSVAQERERLRPQRRGLQRGWAVGRSPHDKGPGSEDRGHETAGSSLEGGSGGHVTTHLSERHRVPGVSEEGYSIEFFDMTGNTVAVVTLPAGALRVPT
jgi:hypothetical protein